MKTVLRFSLLAPLLLGGHAFAAEPKKFDISMFPAAEVNQERVVIRLPEVENKADMMVELRVGKKMLVDSVTCHLRRAIWNSTASGLGYNYLTLGQVSPISTLMACPDGQKKSFVQILRSGLLRELQLKLPFVIYVPQDEVRYRLWRADNLHSQPRLSECRAQVQLSVMMMIRRHTAPYFNFEAPFLSGFPGTNLT